MGEVESIPGFRLERELGRGGMAVVYLAMQESLGRNVALKVLNPRYAAEPGFTERFLREGRIAASLHHRHIVAVHDVGSHEGYSYLAMEYLPLGSIAPAAGRLGTAEVLRCIREIAGALDAAHRVGVVHRDVKPENILRHEDGAFLLSDFGIAHVLGSSSVLTREGSTVGTPAYMSPEQWRSEAVDGRSDLYSLGIVMFQLLTGELPYSGTDGWAMGMQHMSAPVPTLLPRHAHLQELLDALMAKDPARRPQSAAEVVRRVNALQNESQRHTPQDTLPPPSRASRKPLHAVSGRQLAALLWTSPSSVFRLTSWRRRRWWASAALALATLAALTAFWQMRAETPLAGAESDRPAPSPVAPATTAAEGSDNEAAYREYRAGTELLGRLKPDELQAALRHFERAIELDPGYARAYAAAATALGLLREYASVDDRIYERRGQYVERALELAPDLGEAHTAAGDLLEDSGDYEAAEAEYQRGIALAPGSAFGFQRYGVLLLYRKGDADGAVARLERAAALDPRSPPIQSAYGRALLEVGREKEAERVFDRLEQTYPDFVYSPMQRARLEAQRGDLVAALRASGRAVTLQRDSERPLSQYCGLLFDFGAFDAAAACIDRIEERFGVSDRSRESRADLAIRRGDFAQALAYLEASSLSQRSSWSYAELLDLTGQPARALAIYQELAPELLREPLGSPDISDPFDPVLVGAALLHAGKRTQATTLLRYALTQVMTRKRYAGLMGRRWSEVFLQALLDAPQRACEAMERGAAVGYFFDYRLLESDPDLAGLRRHPCFAPQFARIRALAETQVQRAQAAGLLNPP